MSYTVRTMSRAELELTLDWAAAEGWNPGLHDATPFHATDPTGFLVGLLDGEPAATISVVRYPGNYAFLGCYIVSPELRGLGFGRHLWNAGLAYL
jgi:ribosomal protein S18 acetylase RimI-like enzyme